MGIADVAQPDSWASRMRRERVRLFLELLPPDRSISILDVGGTEQFWLNALHALDGGYNRLSITLLNRASQPITDKGRIVRSMVGDARDLSRFSDAEFDFCLSNSVIEHVDTIDDQRRMAREIARVGSGYFVQTPNRRFILEPHFHMFGWAQMPVWYRTFLHRRIDLGWMKAEPNYLQARIDVEQIRLLSVREFRLMFPDGEVHFEKIGPLTKSLIAIRRCHAQP